MEAITADEAKRLTGISKEVLSKAIERINKGIKNQAEGGGSSIGISVPILLVPEIMRIYTENGFLTNQHKDNADTIIFSWVHEEKLMMISR